MTEKKQKPHPFAVRDQLLAEINAAGVPDPAVNGLTLKRLYERGDRLEGLERLQFYRLAARLKALLGPQRAAVGKAKTEHERSLATH